MLDKQIETVIIAVVGACEVLAIQAWGLFTILDWISMLVTTMTGGLL